MSRSIQLQIPKPCHEDWEKMRPEDKGRHCSACQKIVVDFTVMSDTEVFNFFSTNSSSVCGRIGSDQLNRKVAPPLPPVKSRGVGWPWLVAGMLATTYDVVQLGKRSVTVGEMEVRTEKPEKSCDNVKMGTPAVLVGDTVVVADTSMPVVQIGERHEIGGDIIVSGGITAMVVPDTLTDNIAVDSLSAPRVTVIRSILDTVKRVIGDSLMMFGIKSEVVDTAGAEADEKNIVTGGGNEIGMNKVRHAVTMYPNPVMKGGSLYLQSQNGAGQCRVNLYSISGALIQTWMIGDGDTQRALSMPADMATGVYLVQVVMKDGMYTQKLIVE